MAYVPVHSPSAYPRQGGGGGDGGFGRVLSLVFQEKIARQERAREEAERAEIAEMAQGLGSSAEDMATFADRLYDSGRADVAHQVMGHAMAQAGIDQRHRQTAYDEAALAARQAAAAGGGQDPSKPSWQYSPERTMDELLWLRERERFLKEGLPGAQEHPIGSDEWLMQATPEERRALAGARHEAQASTYGKELEEPDDPMAFYKSDEVMGVVGDNPWMLSDKTPAQMRELHELATRLGHPCAERFRASASGAVEAAERLWRERQDALKNERLEDADDLAATFAAVIRPELGAVDAARWHGMFTGNRLDVAPCSGMPAQSAPAGPPASPQGQPPAAPPTPRQSPVAAPTGTSAGDALYGLTGSLNPDAEVVLEGAKPGEIHRAGSGYGVDRRSAEQRLQEVIAAEGLLRFPDAIPPRRDPATLP